MPFNRRDVLKALSLAATSPLLTRCEGALSQQPQRLSTTLEQTAEGEWVRSFSGPAVPQNLEFLDEVTKRERRLHDLFPSSTNPFTIDTAAQLGAGGYGLSIVDRTAMGEVPSAADPPWALNMVPFGVAIDGVIIDPSGPWYDGGPADPQNPFDRACSGWEYDPIFPTVASLVGVPAQVRGHVQPGPGARSGSPGLFHYHGVPRLMLAALRASLPEHEKQTVLVLGYSADGFLIIDSVVEAGANTTGQRLHLFSGYVLRDGERMPVSRTNPALVPPGTFDGTFVQDWRFDPVLKRASIEQVLRERGEYLGLLASDVAAGTATFQLLDERNGLVIDALRLAQTTTRSWAYVLTPDWPEVPRWFAREPSASFRSAIIPLDEPAARPAPGRRQLYTACSEALADVHVWHGRPPY
jgi:hypothetical protein